MTATIFGGQARTSRSMRRYRFASCDTRAPWPWVAAGGTNGTRVNDAGVTVNAAAPRINVDVGVLVEAERQNRVQHGVTPFYPGGSWQTDGVSTLTSTPGVLGPSGAPMAFLAAGTGTYCYQSGKTFTTGQPEVIRWHARQGDASDPRMWCQVADAVNQFFMDAIVNLSTGTVQTNAGTATAQDIGGGLIEVVQRGVPVNTTASGYFGMVLMGASAGTGHYFGGMDLQQGLWPTSPILTPDGSAVTRAADSMACTDLAALGMTQDAWTIAVTAHEPYPDPAPGYPMILRIEGDDGAVVTINKQPDGSIECQIYDGATNLSRNLVAGTPGVQRKYMIGYSRAQQLMRVAATGAAVQDATAAQLATLPDLGTVRLGSANGFWWINQPIAECAVTPRLLSAAEFIQEVES